MKTHTKLKQRLMKQELRGDSSSQEKCFSLSLYGALMGFLTATTHAISRVSVSLPLYPSNLVQKATRREEGRP